MRDQVVPLLALGFVVLVSAGLRFLRRLDEQSARDRGNRGRRPWTSLGPRPPAGITFDDLKQLLHGKLIDKIDLSRAAGLTGAALHREIRLVVEQLVDAENSLLNFRERERLIDEVLDETFGFGPLEGLLRDPAVDAIQIRGPHDIHAQRRDAWEKTEARFRDGVHQSAVLDRVTSALKDGVLEGTFQVDVSPGPRAPGVPIAVFRRLAKTAPRVYTSPEEQGGSRGSWGKTSFRELTRHLHRKLVARLDRSKSANLECRTVQHEIRQVVERLCDQESPLLHPMDRERILTAVLDEMFGFGPLEVLFRDPDVRAVALYNGWDVQVWKGGNWERCTLLSSSDGSVHDLAERLAGRAELLHRKKGFRIESVPSRSAAAPGEPLLVLRRLIAANSIAPLRDADLRRPEAPSDDVSITPAPARSLPPSAVDPRLAGTLSADGVPRSLPSATVERPTAEGENARRVCTGHSGAVSALCASGDGQQFLSASAMDDFRVARWNTLRLWDVRSGRCLRTFAADRGSIAAACLSADGKTAAVLGRFQQRSDAAAPASGWDDRWRVEIWDVDAGERRRSFYPGEDRMTALGLSADGKVVVTGGGGALTLWDMGGVAPPLRWHAHGAAVTGVSLDVDGRRVVSASADGTVKVWESVSGRCTRLLTVDAEPITVLSVDHRRGMALSGGPDGTVRFWDLDAGVCLYTRTGHAGAVTAVCLGPDGQHALSGGEDRTACCWDIAAGQRLRILEGHTAAVTALALVPGGRAAFTGGADRTIRKWDLGSEEEASLLLSCVSSQDRPTGRPRG